MHKVCLKLVYELSAMFGIDDENKPTEFGDFTTYYEV